MICSALITTVIELYHLLYLFVLNNEVNIRNEKYYNFKSEKKLSCKLSKVVFFIIIVFLVNLIISFILSGIEVLLMAISVIILTLIEKKVINQINELDELNLKYWIKGDD